MPDTLPLPDPSDQSDRWNRILVIIFGLLIAYCAVCYVLVLASIPVYIQRVIDGTVPTVILAGETVISNTEVAAETAARGMTPPVYAVYSVTLNLLVTAGFVAAGTLILVRVRRDWFRWLTAFVLIFFPLGGLETLVQVSGYGYSWIALGSMLWPAFFLFLYLFPNGRAVPRWSRWPVGVILLVHLVIQTVGAAGSVWTLPPGIVQKALSLAIFILLGFVLILGCQIYRYRQVSTPVERAQIRWFVAGLLVLVVESVAATLLTGTILASGHGFISDLSNLLTLVIPVSILMAILRYRLWDIDIIIRKTVQYAVISGLLALVYYGTIVLLQTLFGVVLDDAPLLVVASTLLIAALFNPLRRRVQNFIDRRFFRRKYDAQQVLAHFTETVRDETDLERLAAELIQDVRETMQPATVNLWLKK